jgi:hypothetical protein
MAVGEDCSMSSPIKSIAKRFEALISARYFSAAAQIKVRDLNACDFESFVEDSGSRI